MIGDIGHISSRDTLPVYINEIEIQTDGSKTVRVPGYSRESSPENKLERFDGVRPRVSFPRYAFIECNRAELIRGRIGR